MDILEFSGHRLRLARFPLRHEDPLRAWDAADENMLRNVDDLIAAAEPSHTLLINDAFGALGVALHRLRPDSWQDSHLARLALAHNLKQNDLPADAVTFIPGDDAPTGPYDLVLLKLPKSLAWLEDQLLKLRGCLLPDSQVIAGGMIKHTPVRAFRLLEKIIGPTRTGLGWKKSRLAFSSFAPDRSLPSTLSPTAYCLDTYDLALSNDANLFSRERVDLGTRLLLAHLPRSDDSLRIADLGCGNGALGLAAARLCPAASVLFIDESYQAVSCARRNAVASGLGDREINCSVSDGLSEHAAGSLDLILCNPPFHQAQSVGDVIAWRMIKQSHHALAPGGELRLVGNRHLGYHVKMKRVFGGCDVLGSNRKFVVLSSKLCPRNCP